LILFALMAALSYFAAKRYGNKVGLGRGRNVSVMERVYLTQDKILFIVKVGEKFMLLSSSNQNVSLICELNGEELVFDDEKSAVLDFSGMLKSIMKKGNSGSNENSKKDS